MNLPVKSIVGLATVVATLFFAGHALFSDPAAGSNTNSNDLINWQALTEDGTSDDVPPGEGVRLAALQEESKSQEETTARITNPFATPAGDRPIASQPRYPAAEPMPAATAKSLLDSEQGAPARIVNSHVGPRQKSTGTPPKLDEMTRITNPYQPRMVTSLPSPDPVALSQPDETAPATVAQIPARMQAALSNASGGGDFLAIPDATPNSMTERRPLPDFGQLPAMPDLESPKNTQVAETITAAPAEQPRELPPLPRVESKPTRDASALAGERAREHLEYGKSLARRGATWAAREEFVQALSLIAESCDMETGTRDCTTHLVFGLRALSESDDFQATNVEHQLTMDLAPIVASHNSTVLAGRDVSNMAPVQALQAYYQYAADELALAAGNSEVAGEALHCMGKLLTTSAGFDSSGKPLDRAKAMVMFQAALSANPRDHRSANELGVLMAWNGQLEQARDLFTTSLRAVRTPEAWMNLSRTHERLGEHELARQAAGEYRLMANESAPASEQSMAWVDSSQFEGRGAMPESLESVEGERTAQAAEDSGSDQPSAARRLKDFVGSRLKWF